MFLIDRNNNNLIPGREISLPTPKMHNNRYFDEIAISILNEEKIL